MHLTDEQLLEQAATGDDAAMRDLLKRHGPKARLAIQGKVDRRWRTVLDEDDVMQVAYLEAFLHLDQLVSRDTNGFVAWLSRIAQNALRDAVRGLQRDKRPHPSRRIQAAPGRSDSYVSLLETLMATTTTPSQHAAVKEAVMTMESALTRLPKDYRAVVQSYDLDGLGIDEVAEKLGRSVGAVHMLRARAHDRLRQIMGAESKFFGESA